MKNLILLREIDVIKRVVNVIATLHYYAPVLICFVTVSKRQVYNM